MGKHLVKLWVKSHFCEFNDIFAIVAMVYLKKGSAKIYLNEL